MAALIDTNVLLAAMFSKDQYHVQAREALRSLKTRDMRIVPAPVVQELFQMSLVRINYERAIEIFQLIQMPAFDIQPLTSADMVRMSEIMHQYSSAQFDYADAGIMAMSERLNITQVYTFDRRDFSIFRPKHCSYLQLLPN